MKRFFFKQLMMLVIMLFAGIGSAFGQEKTITVNWDYSNSVNVEFYSIDNDVYYGYAVSGVPEEFPVGSYRLYFYNSNPDVYTIASIKVDNDDRTADYDPNKHNYIDINLQEDCTVDISITKAASVKTVTLVDFDKSHAWCEMIKISGNSWNWLEGNSESWELLSGSNYKMCITPRNAMLYAVTAVTVNGVAKAFNMEGNSYYINFPAINDDCEVKVELTKLGESSTVTLTGITGGAGHLEFLDKTKNNYVSGNPCEFLEGSDIRMTFVTEVGYKVKNVTVDETDVTEKYNKDGYYDFDNISGAHTVSVVLEKTITRKVTVNAGQHLGYYRLSSDNANYYVNLDNPNSDLSQDMMFNEGSNIRMFFPCQVRKDDDHHYRVTLKDGDTPVKLVKDEDNDDEYVYMIENVKSDHTLTLVYEQIVYHNVTVNNLGGEFDVRLDYDDDYSYPETGRAFQIAEGTDVKVTIRLYQGFSIESVKLGETDITADYNQNGYYVIKNLSEDVVLNVTTIKVGSYEINTNFDGYPQGKTYFESATYEKEESTWGRFTKGSDVTLYIKPAIGYDVTSVMLLKFDENNNYDSETEIIGDCQTNANKEWVYVFRNLSARYHVSITTTKKPVVAGQTVSCTLGNEGLATFCSEYDLDLTNVSGIKAYIATGYNPDNKKIMLTRVMTIPAGTGVLIKGTPGKYAIPAVNKNFYHLNMLTGTDVPMTINQSLWYNGVQNNNYILRKNDSLFALANSSAVEENEAYLQVPERIAQYANTLGIEYIESGDMNGDGVITVTDTILLLDEVLTNP